MRAFIGIEFPVDITKKIKDIQQMLRMKSDRGRWKRQENFHLTLKFLGDITESRGAEIMNCLDKGLQGIEKFSLVSGEIGGFRGRDCYRVIYLALGSMESVVAELFKIAENCCIESGIESEKREYKPHITIGQDVVFREDFYSIKKYIDTPSIIIPVKSVSLIKSEQIGNRRVYTSVRRVILR
jgi:2'-5' RNA ligase